MHYIVRNKEGLWYHRYKYRHSNPEKQWVKDVNDATTFHSIGSIRQSCIATVYYKAFRGESRSSNGKWVSDVIRNLPSSVEIYELRDTSNPVHFAQPRMTYIGTSSSKDYIKAVAYDKTGRDVPDTELFYTQYWNGRKRMYRLFVREQ